MTLAVYTLRDLARHHPHAVNAVDMVAQSGNFVVWRPLGWSKHLETILPQAARHEQKAAGRLTGQEDTLEEMAQSLGLSTATSRR